MAARILAVFAAAFLVVAPVSAATIAQSSLDRGSVQSAAPIEKQLLAKFKDGKQRFVVEFSAKADLRAATRGKVRAQRGTAVYEALTATAKGSQVEALRVAGSVNGSNPKSYWLTNSLLVTGDLKLARRLAALSGVSSVHAPKIYPLVKPVETNVAILAAAGDPEWGVEKIRRRRGLGRRHPRARASSSPTSTPASTSPIPPSSSSTAATTATATFDHDYNWWDPTGDLRRRAVRQRRPRHAHDGHDGRRRRPGPVHARHRRRTGRAVDRGQGLRGLRLHARSPCCRPASSSSRRPTSTATTPTRRKRPDIVNNSWGGGPGDTFYLETVQAWRAAGIIPVFSSGNPGPFCGEGGSPGDFLEVVQRRRDRHRRQHRRVLRPRPVRLRQGQPGRLGAPASNVVSSVPGGGYEAFSGTSMAAPHASGTLALMLSAEARPASATSTPSCDRRPPDRGRPPRRRAAAATRTATRTTSTARAGSTPRPPSTSSRPAARSPARSRDAATDDADRRRARHRERRRARLHRRHRRGRRLRRCSSPRARTASPRSRSATPARSSRRRHRRPTRRPTRTSRSDPLPRFTVSGHVTGGRGRLAHRGRARHGPSARRSRRRRRMPSGAYTPDPADRRPTRSAPAPAAAPRSPTSRTSARRREDIDPGLHARSASSMTSATAAVRSRSTGSTRPARPRCTATSSPGGCGCRSRSRSTARPTSRSACPTTAT